MINYKFYLIKLKKTYSRMENHTYFCVLPLYLYLKSFLQLFFNCKAFDQILKTNFM